MLKIYKLYKLLDGAERKKVMFLLFLVLVMALLDVLGVASILPFIAVLSDPAIIYRNSFLSNFYNHFGFVSEISFLFFFRNNDFLYSKCIYGF